MEETSAGAIIFRENNDSRLYLLLNYPSGHWDFVKGKMEEGESPHQTVIREAKEETGIEDLDLFSEYEEEIRYDFQFEGELIHKKVIFFLAKTKTEKITISHEHQDFVWLSYEDAMKKTTYENARSILLKAEKLLEAL